MESTMNNFWEILSIVSSIVSLLIGGFAIWLSVTFYKWSNKVSEDTREAAKGISASVDRLEVLFDRLYSDTFGMMKDTVSDMRKHIWSDGSNGIEVSDAIEEKTNEKLVEVKQEIKSELEKILTRVGQTEGKVNSIGVDIDSIVQKAIDETRKIDSDALIAEVDSRILNDVLHFIRDRSPVSVRQVLMHPRLRRTYTSKAIMEAIETNLDADTISANGDLDRLATELSVRVSQDS